MSKLRFFTILVGAVAVAALVPLQGAGGVSPSFRPTDTFKGSALTGWHTVGNATWTAANGEITGTPKSPDGGWLVLDKSFQDVGLFVSFKCAAGCKTGLLVRAEKTADGGMKGVFLPLEPREGTGFGQPAFAVTLDAQGKETAREQLRSGGGTMRVAPPPPPPPDPNAAAARGGRAGGARAGGAGGGRASAPPELAAIQAQVVQPTAIKAGDWNAAELLADANIVRMNVNNSSSQGGVAEEDAGRYGPFALYVGGTGAVSFKDIAWRDLMVTVREPETTGARYKAQQLSDFYYSWGITAADFNKDGVLDVLAGPHIFYGPDYTKRREIYVQQTLNPSSDYSQNVWMQFSADFTGDGWPDAINCGFSNVVAGCYLFVNPKDESRRWDKFRVTTDQTTEIAVLADVNHDGKPDVVYGGAGTMRWATPDPANPTGPWKVHAISQPSTVTAHGVGAGDVNGDGRIDILNAYGWWEQPASLEGDPLWTYHPVPFSRSVGSRASNGGSVMAVYDVNGDGLNDVVTSLSAHGYGLAWYEQKKEKDAAGHPVFVQHMIMDDFTTKNAGDVTFTQLHGSTVADVDGDGIPDFIVGKRYWSHLDDWNDPDPYGPPVLYVYRTVRNAKAPGGAEFVPELVNNRSGAGSDVHAIDLNKDGRMDLLTTTRFGTYIFWGQRMAAGAK